MRLDEIQQRAKEFGIKKISGLNKTDLIHAIQLVEGNFDCFATASIGECDQTSCLWREDCFSSAKKRHNKLMFFCNAE